MLLSELRPVLGRSQLLCCQAIDIELQLVHQSARLRTSMPHQSVSAERWSLSLVDKANFLTQMKLQVHISLAEEDPLTYKSHGPHVLDVAYMASLQYWSYDVVAGWGHLQPCLATVMQH